MGGLRGEHIIGLGVGRNAGRLDEHLLDFGAGVGFLGGHRSGADKHAVDRHVRQTVSVGPLAGDVVGRAFGGADAAAGDQHEVVAGAHFGVGGGEQVIQGFPAVVAAGLAAFDLNHDGGGGHGLGDAHDLTNLVDGAGLEAHVRQTIGLQVLDEFHGLVQLGDAGGNDHAVNRSAGSTLLGHDAGGAELQVPQVAVHEHRVEFNRAAFLKLVFEGGDVAVEHFGGHLAAAGELGPVAGVGGCGHDFRLHGGGGHAGQQHRRLAGELGELGDQLGAGRGFDDARRECLPVLGALGLAFQSGESGALGQRGGFDHADAGALHHVADQLAKRVARAEVHNPQLGRVGGVKQRLDAGIPVHMVEQHFLSECAGAILVKAAGASPRHGLLNSFGHERRMEGQGDFEVFESGVEHSAAVELLFTQLGLVLVLALGFEGKCGQILRVAGQHVVVVGVGDGDGDRPSGVVHALDQSLNLFAGGALDGEHRAGLAVLGVQAQFAHAASAGCTDQGGDGQNLVEGLAGGFDGAGGLDGTGHVHGEHALGVAEHGNRLGGGHTVAKVFQVEQGAELGQGHAFHGCGGVGCSAEAGRVRGEAEQVDRTTGGGQQVRGGRGEQSVGCGDVATQGLVKTGIGGLVCQGDRPRGGLAGESERMRLGGQAVEEEGGHYFPYLCFG